MNIYYTGQKSCELGKSYFCDLMIHCEHIAEKMAINSSLITNTMGNGMNGTSLQNTLVTLFKIQVKYCLRMLHFNVFLNMLMCF